MEKMLKELAEICRIHGSQKKIAKEIGVSEQVLSNWMTGMRRPSLGSFFKIRDFLGKRRE
jgi:transcriptional regulator with XRE-family HTH domain